MSSKDISYIQTVRDLKDNKKAYLFFIKTYKKLFDYYVISEKENPEKLALQKTLKMLSDKFDVKLSGNIDANFTISEVSEPEKTATSIASFIKLFLVRKANKDNIISNIKLGLLSNASVCKESSDCVGYIEYVLQNHDDKYVQSVINSLLKELK